jgi:SAM-dependent methyltransferase
MGDSMAADYSVKLALFDRFAEPELIRLIRDLPIAPGARVLDAGCGAGAALAALRRRVGPGGLVVGVDLSSAHLEAARASGGPLAQADFSRLPFRDGSFDAAWMLNALNHAADPAATLRGVAAAVAPGGRVAIVQSSFLPDMMFAWDLHFERRVYDACLRAYRDIHALDERDTGAIRRLVGLARDAGLADVIAQTIAIERLAPLAAADQEYLQHAVFEGYWGLKLRPYLSARDWSTLTALTDPASPEYVLRRADFHHLQTLTAVVGVRPGGAAPVSARPDP